MTALAEKIYNEVLDLPNDERRLSAFDGAPGGCE
jgi:hypothetical protein